MRVFLYVAIIFSVMLAPGFAAQNAGSADNTQALIDRGDSFVNADRLREATESYRLAVRSNPASSAAHERLAKALRLQDNLDDSIREGQRAVQLDPSNAAARSNLGWVLGLKKRYGDAAREERVAIQLDPSNASSYVTLGLALASLGDNEGAIAANQTAIKLDPENLRAYVNLGATLGRKGAYAEAIEAYRKALAINPRSVSAHLGLGAALGRTGNLAEQISEFRTAVWLAPQSDNAHGKLGWSLYKKGDWQGAFKEGMTTNWLRLSKSGPEYLQNFLGVWGLVFLLFGVIFAVIFFGSHFTAKDSEVIIRSYFLVFYNEKPGRFVITNQRLVFVPEAFSRWFGSELITIDRDQIEKIDSTPGGRGGALEIKLTGGTIYKFVMPQLVHKALVSDLAQAAERSPGKTDRASGQDTPPDSA